jgi:hypothetical protein
VEKSDEGRKGRRRVEETKRAQEEPRIFSAQREELVFDPT